MKRWTALAALALVLGSGTALADSPPSVWDRAKQPEIADEYELHLTAQRMLVTLSEDENLTELLKTQLRGQHLRVLAMLQAAGAEKSSNPLLRYDLAAAYFILDNFPRAAAVWRGAIRDFPSYPITRKAEFDYAISCGKTGDHECEARLYRQILSHETEPDERATPLLNLAETEMHNRDLREAIEDYRETYRLCGSFQAGFLTPALALWGLAVALDRAGEVHEAQDAAYQALSHAGMHPEVLHHNGIFFVPDYEVTWYDGLTAAVQAKHAQGPRERVLYWRIAEHYMTEWVVGGTRAKDYWLPIAKARLATYKAERERAEAELRRAPPVPDEDEDESTPPPPPPLFKRPATPAPPPPPVPFKPTPAPRPHDTHI